MDVVKQCEEILEKNILQYLHSNLTCFEKKKSKRLGLRESGDYAAGLVHPIHIQGNIEVVLHRDDHHERTTCFSALNNSDLSSYFLKIETFKRKVHYY
ncbi:hypothetical protein CDAR_51811 [Caerostris darwini]|uniref:Uncharacterized protein n=1 Tax=Caerostris darwini TaxID=1538125 RepID=A0AAV4V720_9ARAC|nr:hypothetical protein CDAR_51811 [Caerostris darwini]